jgi:MAF protein
MQHRHLVLASQSPRRRQILTISGYEFDVLPSQISEIPDENLNLSAKIRQLAADKARACLKMRTDLKALGFLALAADTVVVLDGQILGKPKDENEARSFLRRLSGRSHSVITGVAMIDSSTSIEFLGHAETTVTFRDLGPGEIEEYIESQEPFDKAGGYGIQGSASRFIARIDGPYDNVVGLPMGVFEEGVKYFAEKIPGFAVTKNLRTSEVGDQVRSYRAEVAKNAREGSNPILIAVSKTKPATDVVMAWLAGQREFGENYAQEAIEKKSDVEILIRSISPAPSGIRWHFIGHLQSKKVKYVVGEFDLIHSVDRFSLAEEISKRASAKNIIQPILLQLNFAEEDTKSGVAPEEFVELAKRVCALPGLSLQGLMALPPLLESDEETRKQLLEIARVFEKTKAALPPKFAPQFKELSLGTTHDFRQALNVGATMVRIGTAIFGARS